MIDQKKIAVLFGIIVFLIIGMAASKPPQDDDHFTNLKVLPKNTTDEEMDRIMYGFKRQLGVNCTYCHADKKGAFPPRIDFASDEKPEKKIAREMMKMCVKINKKYFGIKENIDAFRKPKINCMTCHRGYAVPPGTK